jgi:glutathione synthase/RimK-type ligase-like ATP-grasp enzyme
MSGLALVLGLPREPPVAAVARELARLGAPHAVVDQRRLLAGDCRVWFDGATAGGEIRVDAARLPLEEVAGVYTRLTSWGDLPEAAAAPDRLDRARRLHEAIDAWLEVTAARVVNRTSANDTNNSKPYQALIIREHFDVPATLVTNDPGAVEPFRREFGRLVYKSASGERSIVTELTDADLGRLHLLASGPVQFQEHVGGVDVRVHVVGADVFATRVDSDATDYRYDRGRSASMAAVAVSDSVAAACVALTARLGLELSGIDLRYADDGRIVCFEVNPSPAYTVYEDATGQPIAAAIARRLAGA